MKAAKATKEILSSLHAGTSEKNSEFVDVHKTTNNNRNNAATAAAATTTATM